MSAKHILQNFLSAENVPAWTWAFITVTNTNLKHSFCNSVTLKYSHHFCLNCSFKRSSIRAVVLVRALHRNRMQVRFLPEDLKFHFSQLLLARSKSEKCIEI